MDSIIDYRDRQVIPIWRGFSQTLERGELDSESAGSPSAPTESSFTELLLDWKLKGGVSVASDLVCAAWSTGNDKVAIDAAEFLVRTESVPPLAREIASLYLRSSVKETGTSSEEPAPMPLDLRPFYLEISRTRLQLAQYGRNPILWANLARIYTTLGEQEKAERAMRVALAQAPENRYILRAAARLYLHHGQGDRSHRLLLRSSRLTFDPWILSAEVATASALGKTSLNIRKARRMLEAARHPPFHLSELASAIGTLDARAGNRKSGRRLVEFSLRVPSDNSVAQADWLARVCNLPRVEWVDRSISPEAISWHASSRSDWPLAIRAVQVWQRVQPFSSRPATFCSYLANEVLEDYDLAIRVAEFGLKSNEDDHRLRNNLAYGLAAKGEIPRALQELKRASQGRHEPRDLMFQTATNGFIAYRAGAPEIGRGLYNVAISLGKQHRFDNWEAIAMIHLALEALRANESDAEELRRRALDKSATLKETWEKVMIARLKGFPVATTTGR